MSYVTLMNESCLAGDTLERIYLGANPEAAEEGLQAISTGLSRFINQYTKG